MQHFYHVFVLLAAIFLLNDVSGQGQSPSSSFVKSPSEHTAADFLKQTHGSVSPVGHVPDVGSIHSVGPTPGYPPVGIVHDQGIPPLGPVHESLIGGPQFPFAQSSKLVSAPQISSRSFGGSGSISQSSQYFPALAKGAFGHNPYYGYNPYYPSPYTAYQSQYPYGAYPTPYSAALPYSSVATPYSSVATPYSSVATPYSSLGASYIPSGASWPYLSSAYNHPYNYNGVPFYPSSVGAVESQVKDKK